MIIKKIFQFASIYVCFVKIIIFGKTIGYSNVHYFHNGVHPPKKRGTPLVVLKEKKTLYGTYFFVVVHNMHSPQALVVRNYPLF
jgi:hypothetical protein